MDSLTHIALGACIGEAILGHKIGKKALLIGALAQSIPDIDFIESFWLTEAEQLIAHRGITHSFFFIALVSPILGLFFQRLLKNQVSLNSLTLFFLAELFVHLFLDAFNNYGVGWFEPFSDIRISFNTIYVADVLMTIVPVIALIVLIILPSDSSRRKRWSQFGIAWSWVYLCICIFNKLYITHQVNNSFTSQKIPQARYFTTPAPLQSMLWMLVAGDGKGYYVGYRSVFDTKPVIKFQYFPANNYLLDSLSHHDEIDLLKRFSQGYYTVEKWSDTLVFNDLRFGQIIGWQDPKEKFVFHYFIQHPGGNRLVVQRGRFAKWDLNAIRVFLRRIAGN